MKTLEDRVTALEAAIEALRPFDLGDLSSEWNDFRVRKDPRSWLDAGGASFEGQRLSECPPAYLDALAGLFEWMAKKDEEKGEGYVNRKGETVSAATSAGFKRKDAARARAWAAKLRESVKGNVGPAADENDAAEQPLPF